MMVQRRKTQVDRNVAEFLMGIVNVRMNLEIFVDAVLAAESTKGQRKPINILEGNNKSVR